jgi:hypothetical protein
MWYKLAGVLVIEGEVSRYEREKDDATGPA